MRIAWPLLDLVMVFILGLPGTGKTTFAAKIAKLWKAWKYKYRPVVAYARIGRPRDVEAAVDAAVEAARGRRARALAIVLDDVSFALSRDRDSLRALNLLMRIRHEEPGIRWWLLVIVAHYARSVPPALRAAHIRVLTSITPEEVEALKAGFPEGALWDFWETWRHWKRPGLALVNNMGDVTIYRWTKPRTKAYWDIVINSNIETEMKEGEGRRRR